jgi:hypothetical protein
MSFGGERKYEKLQEYKEENVKAKGEIEVKRIKKPKRVREEKILAFCRKGDNLQGGFQTNIIDPWIDHK